MTPLSTRDARLLELAQRLAFHAHSAATNHGFKAQKGHNYGDWRECKHADCAAVRSAAPLPEQPEEIRLLLDMAEDWTNESVVRDAPERVPAVIEQLIEMIERLSAALPVIGSVKEPEPYTRTDSEAAAWREIARRLDDAHAYSQKHNLRLGLNVWHAILDDAIKLRAQSAAPEAPKEHPNG